MSREISFRAEGGRILIDDEPFDWGLDVNAIEEANSHSSDAAFMRSIHMDIMGHLLDSLSEVLGFRPSMGQVNEALVAGFIKR